MNEQHQKLYQQIQDYSLDQPEDPFPFGSTELILQKTKNKLQE